MPPEPPARPPLARASLVFVGGFLSIGVMGLIAWASGSPFVFPSLGPTAYLVFASPSEPSSSPRNTILGHTVGVVCGYASLWILGLADHPPATEEGVGPARVICAALSLASTGAILLLLNVPHAPAGATTLIISLGILARPKHLLVIELGVILLTIQAIAVNRLAGATYPLWANPTKADAPPT